MTGSLALLLVYEPASGGSRPLTLARIGDRRLVIEAAQHALNDAESKARALSDADSMLGAVEYEEVERLRRVLAILAPELRERNSDSTSPAPVM